MPSAMVGLSDFFTAASRGLCIQKTLIFYTLDTTTNRRRPPGASQSVGNLYTVRHGSVVSLAGTFFTLHPSKNIDVTL